MKYYNIVAHILIILLININLIAAVGKNAYSPKGCSCSGRYSYKSCSCSDNKKNCSANVNDKITDTIICSVGCTSHDTGFILPKITELPILSKPFVLIFYPIYSDFKPSNTYNPLEQFASPPDKPPQHRI